MERFFLGQPISPLDGWKTFSIYSSIETETERRNVKKPSTAEYQRALAEYRMYPVGLPPREWLAEGQKADEAVVQAAKAEGQS
jgi:hypothetical protein